MRCIYLCRHCVRETRVVLRVVFVSPHSPRRLDAIPFDPPLHPLSLLSLLPLHHHHRHPNHHFVIRFSRPVPHLSSLRLFVSFLLLLLFHFALHFLPPLLAWCFSWLSLSLSLSVSVPRKTSTTDRAHPTGSSLHFASLRFASVQRRLVTLPHVPPPDALTVLHLCASLSYPSAPHPARLF